jgi:PAS domain-containing protein
MKRELFAHTPTPRRSEPAASLADGPEAAQNALARIILDEIRQFVSLLDERGRLLTTNRMALAAAGVSLDDVRGMPFWETPWWQGTR